MVRQHMRKEWMALRPAWVAGLILASVPLMIWPEADDSPGWIFIAYLGWTLLAIGSFCPEFAHGTFHLLLSLPQDRRQTWREKVSALRRALGSILLIFLVGAHGVFLVSDRSFSYSVFLAFVVGGLACAVGGGLYFSLHFRHTAAAFAFTLVLPLALFVTTALAIEWSGGQVEESPFLAVPHVVVGVVLFALAHRRFLLAEDIEPLAAEVIVLGLRRRKRRAAAPVPRLPSPTRSLIAKELRLQQITYVFAGLLVLIAGSILGLTLSRPSEYVPTYVESTRFMWLLLWGLVPVFVGGVSISEERRLGLFEWQLVLPVTRRRQWLLKTITAYVLALTLGVGLPWALNFLLFSWPGTTIPMVSGDTREVIGFHLGFWLVGTTLGLHASSLSRQLIHALSLTVATALILGAFLWFLQLLIAHLSPPVFPLLAIVCAGIILPALIALSRHNYLHPELNRAVWRTNLATFSGAWVATLVLTAAIYCRTWEVILTEPAPAPVAPMASPAQPRIRLSDRALTLLAPDGGLWRWERDETRPRITRSLADLGRDVFQPQRLGAGGERDWRDVVMVGRRIVGLKADGSLWHDVDSASASVPGRGRIQVPARRMVLLDLGPWRQVAGTLSQLAALKEDGSLWTAGVRHLGQPGDRNRLAILEDPQDLQDLRRLGGDTNWTLIEAASGSCVAAKSDGSRWGWGIGFPLGLRASHHDIPQALPGIDAPNRPASAQNRWITLKLGDDGGLGIKADGSLWAWGVLGSMLAQDPGPGAIVRVGQDHDWRAVACSWRQVYGIKQDGTLWRWQPSVDGTYSGSDSEYWEDRRPQWVTRVGALVGLGRREDPLPLQPRRIGRRTDWVCVTAFYGSSFGMTADGAFWAWGRPMEETAFLIGGMADSGGSFARLTRYSERPRRVMNVITGDVY